MAKLAKKQIREIESVSIFTDIIRETDSSDIIAGQHWVDLPPDMWCDKDRTRIYDMMNELEMKLKDKILTIVRGEE